MEPLRYLRAYSPDLQQQVQALIDQGTLGEHLLKRYPTVHDYRSDNALYHYANDVKKTYMRGAAPLEKAYYDSKLRVIEHALGQHHYVSRVHGGKLKSANFIKIASLFKQAPEAFLRMIVVHELAHFKEKEHNRAFYQLCCHMEPQYHQYEFDMRVYLTHLDLFGALYR
jgi:predicted metal-dependent hydrolase